MKKLAVLSGAGISKESGLSTFRDSDGLWENYSAQEVASIEGWYRNKSLMLKFYNERRRQIEHTEPNEAHRILAQMEKDWDVDIITQNIDNLHERAGSTKVIHLHGLITQARGENHENKIYDIGYKDIHLGDLAPTGDQLRPHIVWFGEAVPMIEPAIRIVEKADILLVVGTSLNVYPAAGLIQYISPGTPIYLVDPTPMNLHYDRYTQIQDVATKGVAKFAEMVAPYASKSSR
ncbi:MAG: NAD-dependent protein deacylase [Bacteroidales bacterium]|nr:NAD-dependent protein deacylase [Bacteroidales bacterium]